MNRHNYTKSIRNNRFEGCKLPDVNTPNDISYPMYTINYSYIDVNDDPSAIIVLKLTREVLPEWLRAIRERRGQR